MNPKSGFAIRCGFPISKNRIFPNIGRRCVIVSCSKMFTRWRNQNKILNSVVHFAILLRLHLKEKKNIPIFHVPLVPVNRTWLFNFYLEKITNYLHLRAWKGFFFFFGDILRLKGIETTKLLRRNVLCSRFVKSRLNIRVQRENVVTASPGKVLIIGRRGRPRSVENLKKKIITNKKYIILNGPEWPIKIVFIALRSRHKTRCAR